jgi:hypothetical protein
MQLDGTERKGFQELSFLAQPRQRPKLQKLICCASNLLCQAVEQQIPRAAKPILGTG